MGGLVTAVLEIVLVASVVANAVCLWLNFRSIKAYYDAHDMLLSLCLQAWQLKHRGELFPIYDDTLGARWRLLMRRPK